MSPTVSAKGNNKGSSQLAGGDIVSDMDRRREESATTARVDAGKDAPQPPPPAKPAPVSRIPQAMVVLAQAEVPPDCPPATPLPELLHRLLPEHLPSITAAKRALRRRLVLRIPAAAFSSSSSSSSAAAAAPASFSCTPTGGDSTSSSSSAATAASSTSAPPNCDTSTTTTTTTALGDKPHPSGVLMSTADLADPRDVLQLLARSGSGYMGWVGPEEAAGGGGSSSSSKRGSSRRGSSSGAAAGEDGDELGRLENGSPSGQLLQPQAAVQGEVNSRRHLQKQLPSGLPIAYEDDHLAVVIKPPGIETQGSGDASVQGRLKYCLRPTPLVGALHRPKQVHRLDLPTGGLLLAAKTHVALRGLAADLHNRRVTKRYCALVKGIRGGSRTIDMQLSGKPCVTYFEALLPPPGLTLSSNPTSSAVATAEAAVTLTATAEAAAPAASVATAASAATTAHVAGCTHVPSPRHGALCKVLLWPHTGRTHQLRKHMAYTGTP
ncbi:hypothetical protein Agub_g13729, partial [Astrephomene gubernaculifera]